KNSVLELAGNRVAFMERTQKPVVILQPFAIEIDSGPDVTEDGMANAIASVFEKNMAVRLANYWKASKEYDRAGVIEGDRAVYRVRPDKAVKPPTPLYSPDPVYYEGARQKNIQGTVLFQVVVNEEGIPEMFALE